MEKRKHLIAPSVLSLLLIAALIWGYNQNTHKRQLQVTLENHYQRLFYDIKKHTENVQVSLSKALLATSKERNIMNFSQIVSEANFAQDKLNQLPIQHADNNKISKFLSQSSDYATYLIQKHLEGEDITAEQRKALTGLQMNSATFNGELANLHQSMMGSNFIVGMGMNQQIESANENILNTSLVTLDQQMGKSPELIYDGPFADQILNKKPVGLSGEQVDLNKAQQVAIDFFGKDKINGVEPFEQGEQANEQRIPAYSFHLYPDNNNKDYAVYVGVARQGGKVLWLENPRPAGDKSLSVEEGQKRALEYLKSKGFDSMEPNYSLQYDGIVLYNFAYKQDDVTIYPDLVKVKVALDNGEIVGFDASPYYLNHQMRNVGRPTIELEEARGKVKTDFDIDSVRLAIIPKGKSEILCYEFKGKYNDADFIVYINAKDGKEEQILQIIKNENGTLTF